MWLNLQNCANKICATLQVLHFYEFKLHCERVVCNWVGTIVLLMRIVCHLGIIEVYLHLGTNGN